MKDLGSCASARARRWLALVLWPFPNLRTWAAFAIGVVTGEFLIVLLVAAGWMVIRP